MHEKTTLLFRFSVLLFCSLSSFLSADWKTELQQKVSENNPPAWMLEQIEEDLAPFANGITQEMINATLNDDPNWSYEHHLGKYQIIDNIIFSSENKRDFADRFVYITQALREIAECAPLPNTEFIVCIHDSFPLLEEYITGYDQDKIKAPILGFAKDTIKDTKVVLIPDNEATNGYEYLFNEIRIGQFPWEEKINAAIWRGAMTGGYFTKNNFLTFPRSQLVNISLDNPSFVDARYVGIGQCESAEEINRGYTLFFGQFLSRAEHLRYKYQILVDGNSCAYSRAYWQLLSQCVIFKHSSNNIQWYNRALKPYEHYIPVNNDFSDLIEKITWARNHDSEARQIAENARLFAENNLRHSDIMYYIYLLLWEYAKLQKN